MEKPVFRLHSHVPGLYSSVITMRYPGGHPRSPCRNIECMGFEAAERIYNVWKQAKPETAA